tara:strand:- start:993 stop:1295 length:303 start_codon:yes stop_codon:yes gene_type:complete
MSNTARSQMKKLGITRKYIGICLDKSIYARTEQQHKAVDLYFQSLREPRPTPIKDTASVVIDIEIPKNINNDREFVYKLIRRQLNDKKLRWRYACERKCL